MRNQQLVMEKLILLLCILNYVSLQEQAFFAQKLDHLNPSDTREWQQRYWKSEEFYQPGGAVFLWIYGVEPATPSYMKYGQMSVYAKKFGALCFTLEHRFFGESKPTKDTSVDNLAYLNREQAIEDIAEFIKGMNTINNLPAQTKWFAFGGSYGASLAAWFRLKHPELIHGAIASSAILLAKLEYAECYRSIQSTLGAYNAKCPTAIQNASDAIRESFKTEAGRKDLTQIFLLCTELANNPVDLNNLFAYLALNIERLVEHNKNNINIPTNTITVDTICDILIREKVPPITSFAEVQKMILNANGQTCENTINQEDIDAMKQVGYETANESGRLWKYVACSGLGIFATSSQPSDLYGTSITIDWWLQSCQDVFGKTFDRTFLEDRIARNNQNYGGLDINVNNTVFVYGSNDPWHLLGVTEAQSGKSYQVIRIEGGSHCSDIYTAWELDSEEVKAAREKILNILSSWIATE